MSAKRQKSKTVTGKTFYYEGDLTFGLIIHPINKQGQINEKGFSINATIIDLVKRKIKASQDINMGSCRDNPSEDSLGATLQAKKRSPQYLCYIIPLLQEQGFCKAYKVGGGYRVKYLGQGDS